MSELTKDQLIQLVDDTFSWSDNVSEIWTDTPYQEHIETQKGLIKNSIRSNDLDKARVLLFELAQFLDNSEREY